MGCGRLESVAVDESKSMVAVHAIMVLFCLEEDGAVETAETDVQGEDEIGLERLRFRGNEAFRAFGRRCETGLRRQLAMFQKLQRINDLQNACGTECVARVAFDGNQWARRGEDTVEGGDFGRVIENRACTVADDAADVVWRDFGIVKRTVDERRERLAGQIRSGDMGGVA